MPNDFVVVANRLPVDRTTGPDGEASWRRSPGGLVSAIAPVMRSRRGAWLGWTGSPGEELAPFTEDGMDLVPITLSADEIELYYEGFSNSTLWPLYHDVIAPPVYDRRLWDSYVTVNQRFAEAAAKAAAPGAVVWVQDYQLQLVPAMLRELRADVRIGFFLHIPFPPVELFQQLPWRQRIVEGLLGADLVGFQRPGAAANFLRLARRVAGVRVHSPYAYVQTDQTHGSSSVGVPEGSTLRSSSAGVPADSTHRSSSADVQPDSTLRSSSADVPDRRVKAQAFPISVDVSELAEIVRRPRVWRRAAELREDLGAAKILLGVDRLDYTKGIGQRLQAFGELFDDGDLKAGEAVFVQIATPSRERVEQYQRLRDEIEQQVGRINGENAQIGAPVIHYMHSSYDREELVALYLAADVMVVTPLRDGMNLVAKEYVAARSDLRGALVLSEFAGAADELRQAYLVNPYDIDGLKSTLLQAMSARPPEQARRLRVMRRRVEQYDVNRWAEDFLTALEE